jgi:SAM-dependent methyltransferase
LESKNVDSIYTSGKYLEINPTWHAEDSPWKADQIIKIICNNHLHPQKIAEIGCGTGAILDELSRKEYLKGVQFSGYDISPQAVELAKQKESPNVRFFYEDLLLETNTRHFDILLAIDVLEHVADYIGFLEKCRAIADYKIFHIPLEIHVSSVFRNAFIRGRYTLGHIHYFTADSAIATLKDAHHQILDYFYTSGGLELFKQHPSIKRTIANVPRWLFSKFSLPFTARVFGGYSLLVLTQ